MAKLPINIYGWFESLPHSIVELYNNKFKEASGASLKGALGELLKTNYKIWRYEDDARRTDIPDKDIVNLKRGIDENNQKRNDLIDAINSIIKQDIEKSSKQINSSGALNSETPGSIFDRLSVLALRIFNLKKETKRKGADKSHIERCSNMLKEVEERSRDLLQCLKELLEDYYSGRRRLKSYKQHKLYNDPELNPALRK